MCAVASGLCVSLSQLHQSRSERVPDQPRFMSYDQLVDAYWCKQRLEKAAATLRLQRDRLGRQNMLLQAVACLGVLVLASAVRLEWRRWSGSS